MNRLDFSNKFNTNKNSLEDYNNHFNAIDAIYNLLKPFEISDIEWGIESNYDLSFKITSKKLPQITNMIFSHLSQFMEVHIIKINDNNLSININYIQL